MEFDDKLYEKLIWIKDIAMKGASNLSKEEIGHEKTKNSLHGLIYSQIAKASYETPGSIFHFCANLFVKMLMGHKLTSGNKRVSILFLAILLRYFGYHLDWSKGINKNYKYYESIIKDFGEKLEKGYNEMDIKLVEGWIKNHVVIALEWRK